MLKQRFGHGAQGKAGRHWGECKGFGIISFILAA